MTDVPLVWRPEAGLEPAAGPGGGPLLAADSWLVRDGRVRGLERHRQRFFAACAEAAEVPPDRLWPFWRAVLDALPREGLWFPRVELTEGSLRLRVRPAPPLAADVRVWVPAIGDPRTVPRRKGPDLAALAELRSGAARRSAQEALLTSRGGLVLEAANASVLWWEGGRLCAPAPNLSLLPGVTRAIILDRARELGVPVTYRRRPPTQLNGREAWLVNALHGIRPVTRWVEAPILAGPAHRAPAWQAWLDGEAEPLPDRPAAQDEVLAG
jgi:branched-subunit amino acid aminotransferase/4-amino-4-deoxychorismate lyase